MEGDFSFCLDEDIGAKLFVCSFPAYFGLAVVLWCIGANVESFDFVRDALEVCREEFRILVLETGRFGGVCLSGFAGCVEEARA